MLYKTLVRPHLEFASTVWSPHHKYNIDATERVQWRATKMLATLQDLSYRQRLEKLKLKTLEYRRRRADLLETYQIMFPPSDNVPTFIQHGMKELWTCAGKNSSAASDFTEFHREDYQTSRGASHLNLPPTSQGLLPHIERSYYNTYLITHAVMTADILPEQSGYKLEDGQLIPATSWKVIENRSQVTCKCLKCARQSCPCRSAGVKCVRFCRCQINNDCRNPIP